MANKYTLKASVTSHLQISIPETETLLLARLENKCAHGYNTHSFEAEDIIDLVVRHDIAASVV
jgi:hypothetical protein